MVSRTRLKSILTGLALYTMAALMVGYFGVNAYTGKYGLNARQELDQEIIALTSELARLKRERAQGEQRVSLLRSNRVDPDMLDERARFQLDYANPRDLVRTIKPNWFSNRCHERRHRPDDAGMPVCKFQKTAKSISKMSRHAAVRHSNIFSSARNPFTPV
jgi:cell division protein FtsB